MNFEQMEVENIPEVLTSIQHTSAAHLRYAMLLKTAVDKDDSGELLKKMQQCIQHAFRANYKERNIYVERIISFTTIFATSFKSKTPDDGIVRIHPTLCKIFKFILELSQSVDESHRYWSCTLFNKIFQNLEELSEELYEEVKKSMLERLRDPKAAIRCQAIIALHRLQDPTDEHDEIIAYINVLLDSDFNAKVRQLCLEKVALNKQVLPFVINRIRDVDPNVRLVGFQKLQTVAKYLKVTQKRLILQCGFNDSSEKIRNFTSTTLLQSWLKSYNEDYLKLMKSIRLDACEEDVATTKHLVELMLMALFTSASVEEITHYININEEKLIDYGNLNWESVLYYRIAIRYLRKSEGFEDALDTILPELVHFCKYIKGYCEFMKGNEDFNELEYHFTLEQLFLITQGYDVSDAASRQCLNSLVHHLLQNEGLPADTFEIILNNLEKTIPNVSNRSIFVCEMISYIIYGEEAIDFGEIERKERERIQSISQVHSDINSLQDQEKHFAFVEKNFAEAQRVKTEIEEKRILLKDLKTVTEREELTEKKTDVATLSKCLNIAEALLRSPSIKKFNPAVATLHSEVISNALVHEDDGVKAKALKCYALCCVIDERTARYGIHLFSGLIFATDLTDVQIIVTSIKVIVDMLSIYGLSLVEKRDEEEASESRREEEKKIFVGGTSLTDLIQALADHLDHEESQIQDIATKGVCILLLHSRITSSSLLSRIIIKWANPATENGALKQFIGCTLNALVALPNCRTYFPEGVISTIRTLSYAPKGSALADIDVDNIIKFMVVLCQLSSQAAKIHTDLALTICYQMREKPRIKVNFYFSKTLLLLNIPEDESRDELLAICDDLRDVIRDKQVLKNIDKFNTNLTKINTKIVPIKEENAINEVD